MSKTLNHILHDIVFPTLGEGGGGKGEVGKAYQFYDSVLRRSIRYTPQSLHRLFSVK
jgi:hypothetical protein